MAADRIDLKGELGGEPPLDCGAVVRSAAGALALLETWFELCSHATFQIIVVSDAAPPQHHTTHSHHLALHFIATALEEPLAGSGAGTPGFATS
jgi:hypothetical protein